jgi:hypothetical protein
MTAAAGMNLPHLVYLDALGCPLPDKPSGQVRVRWADEFRDWRLCATGQVPLDELLRGYSGVNCLSLCDRDDPEPFDMALRNARNDAGVDRPLFELVLDHLLTTCANARLAGSRAATTACEGGIQEVRP